MNSLALRRLILRVLNLIAVLAASTPRPASAFDFLSPVHPAWPIQVISGATLPKPGIPTVRAHLQRCLEDGLPWARLDLGSLSPSDPDFDLPACLELARGRLNLLIDPGPTELAALDAAVAKAGMRQQVLVLLASGGNTNTPAAGPASHFPALAFVTDADHAPSSATDTRSSLETQPRSVRLAAPQATPESVTAWRQRGFRIVVDLTGKPESEETWRHATATGPDWILSAHPEALLAWHVARSATRPSVRMALHRGAGRYAPENTLPAFSTALQLG
ncbi:MAG: hypothetical protein IT580_20185, partial [Verrucomicrobiales bacterium]|nr:hypothetical protein [Verrucomicrobiales bacterium]